MLFFVRIILKNTHIKYEFFNLARSVEKIIRLPVNEDIIEIMKNNNQLV